MALCPYPSLFAIPACVVSPLLAMVIAAVADQSAYCFPSSYVISPYPMSVTYSSWGLSTNPPKSPSI
eukprot:6719008-Karenia_brevis.AAC.1